MRTDGRTDTTKLIVSFRNFANALKNEPLSVGLAFKAIVPVLELNCVLLLGAITSDFKEKKTGI